MKNLLPKFFRQNYLMLHFFDDAFLGNAFCCPSTSIYRENSHYLGTFLFKKNVLLRKTIWMCPEDCTSSLDN